MKIRIVKPDATARVYPENTWYCESDTIEIDIDKMVYDWFDLENCKFRFAEFLQEQLKSEVIL